MQRAVGQPGEPPRLPMSAEAIDPTTLVRRVQTQRLLLALIGRLQAAAPAPPTAPARAWTQALSELTTPLDTTDTPPELPLRERLIDAVQAVLAEGLERERFRGLTHDTPRQPRRGARAARRPRRAPRATARSS